MSGDVKVIRSTKGYHAACRANSCRWPGAKQWVSKGKREPGDLEPLFREHAEQWHGTHAAAADLVPGFRLYQRERDSHLECRDQSCTWRGPTDRWLSPGRRDTNALVRFALTHANRHHADPPVRAA